MAGYPGLGRIEDPATQAVCKQLFDQIARAEKTIARLEATALQQGSAYNAHQERITALADPIQPPDAVTLRYLRAYVAAQLALALGGASGAVVVVDPAGALDGDGSVPAPLAVRVDGVTVTIVANRLVAAAGGSGMNQLTGEVTAGPGTGSQAATITRGLFGPASVTLLTNGTDAPYTVPAGIYRIKARVQGGGGGGGGAEGTTTGIGSGGASGGYCEKVYSVVPGQVFTYTVSSTGAAGGSGNASGTAGASAIFDIAGSPVTAGGGGGGLSTATGSALAILFSGSGGTATGGHVNIPGGSGMSVARNATNSYSMSSGANSLLGHGGNSGANSAGGDATGYGAGGGGTVTTNTVASKAGGTGAPGIIIVEEYN